MYEYNYSYDGSAITAGASIFAGIMIFVWIIAMLAGIIYLVSMFKIFKKAGKPGWAAIVPIYNIIVMTEIAGLPGKYVLFMFLPFVQIYAMIKIIIELCKKFGKDTGFAILMILLPLIGYPVLAFSKCTYNGEGSVGTAAPSDNASTPETAEPLPDVVASPEMSSAPINQNLNIETQTLTEVEAQTVQEPVQSPAEEIVDNNQPSAPAPVDNSADMAVSVPETVQTTETISNVLDANNVVAPSEQAPIENISNDVVNQQQVQPEVAQQPSVDPNNIQQL